MSAVAQKEGQSDQSEDEDAQGSKLECFDASKHFNKQELIKQANDYIKKQSKDVKYDNKQKVNLHENIQKLDISKYFCVFNEIDWKLSEP